MPFNLPVFQPHYITCNLPNNNDISFMHFLKMACKRTNVSVKNFHIHKHHRGLPKKNHRKFSPCPLLELSLLNLACALAFLLINLVHECSLLLKSFRKTSLHNLSVSLKYNTTYLWYNNDKCILMIN